METDRLLLRRWQAEDLGPFAAMNADPVVMAHYPACLTRDESRLFIARAEEKFEANGFGLWAVSLKATGAFIGYVGLNIPAFEAAFTPCVEVGWRLAREFWGLGYATEGAKACLRFGFQERGLNEILSWTTHANTRSRKVMERIGMTHDPVDNFNHPALPDDSPLKPHVLYRARSAHFKKA